MIRRLFKQAFKIMQLKAENKKLKELVAQKDLTIQYLNSCVSKANSRYVELVNSCDSLDFPNSELYGQMSISDILEN